MAVTLVGTYSEMEVSDSAPTSGTISKLTDDIAIKYPTTPSPKFDAGL